MATKSKLKSTPVKKPVYGKPEKPNILQLVLIWGFIITGVAGIVWMIATNPPQKRLSCTRAGGQTSLIEFGTCTEE